jgi:hypothetical protein
MTNEWGNGTKEIMANESSSAFKKIKMAKPIKGGRPA